MCKETMRRVIRHSSDFEYSSLQQAIADYDATTANVKDKLRLLHGTIRVPTTETE